MEFKPISSLVSWILGTWFAHLFAKVTRPGDSEGTFAVFESSCHLSSYHLLTVLPLKVWVCYKFMLCPSKDTSSKLADLTEPQAGRLCMPTF